MQESLRVQVEVARSDSGTEVSRVGMVRLRRKESLSVRRSVKRFGVVVSVRWFFVCGELGEADEKVRLGELDEGRLGQVWLWFG